VRNCHPPAPEFSVCLQSSGGLLHCVQVHAEDGSVMGEGLELSWGCLKMRMSRGSRNQQTHTQGTIRPMQRVG